MKLRFEKRLEASHLSTILVPLASFVISLLLGALLLAANKANPWQTYHAMFMGSFGSLYNFSEVIVKATPLILTGLGVALAFRLRFWNIGAEGQLIWGGIGASVVGLFVTPAQGGNLIYLLLAIMAAMAGGALWAGIPALLKTRLKVDETLTTLMMNYMAILSYQYLYNGPWRDPEGFGFPGSRQFSQAIWLPKLVGRSTIGIIIALVIALVLWFVLTKTKWGFELTMIGKNPRAAHVLGVNSNKNILVALLISGALSGLAGGFEVLGVSHRLQQGLNLGYGYTAIIIAWMAALNPLSVVLAALLMAMLLVGGDQVQMIMRLPSAVGLVLQGLILIPLLGGAVFSEYRLRFIGDKKDV
ncbi:MAG: ABC transporter permease [Spirochaetaceae bacterium]|jgi:ABC-type uncharacterized transport system permease subunit|nr:ABC transporter permease [Spirochaetaceae bacterium]